MTTSPSPAAEPAVPVAPAAGADSATSPCPTLILAPGVEYATQSRLWQGIPGIERTPCGRLWATWYTGADGEGPGNHCVLITSADDGATWTEPVAVIVPHTGGRTYDPCLWIDPLGRLWWFVAQSLGQWHDGRAGTWAVRMDDADSPAPAFAPLRFIAPGVMMNKPTVTAAGEWLAPIAVWGSVKPFDPAMAHLRFSNVYVAADDGESWTLRGSADVPNRAFDEHMVVERRDGSLWMLVRCLNGVGEAFSSDAGRTWSPGAQAKLAGPDARFFVRRLASGRLLWVHHAGPDGTPHTRAPKRLNLTAWLSDDDGITWQGGLLLDERFQISYPDGKQAPDGRIYLIYDFNRGDKYSPARDREILMAVITEDDILAGKLVSPKSRLRALVNKVV